MDSNSDYIKRLLLEFPLGRLTVKFITIHGMKYKLSEMPWKISRIPKYLDRMQKLYELNIDGYSSVVITDELTALKTLTVLKLKGDCVLQDQSLILPTLKKLSLTDVDLRPVDINRSLRALGQLEHLYIERCHLPHDYILDLSNCTELKSVTILNTILYNIPLLEDCTKMQTLKMKHCRLHETALHDTDLSHIQKIRILRCNLVKSIPDWCKTVSDILIKDKTVLIS